MFIYIHKKTKQVMSSSKERMSLDDKFDIEEVDDNEDFDGQLVWYKDKKLIKEKIKNTISKKELEQEIDNIKDINELKPILKKLVK